MLTGAVAPILTSYALSAGAPPLVIAAIRLTLAALVVMPFALRQWNEIRSLSRRDLLLVAFSGIWMALHFVMVVSSLQFVGVLVVSVLVTSSPIWTALVEITVLKTRFTRFLFFGVAAVITGNILFALAGDSGGVIGSNPVLGALLAVGAAIAIAMQRVIGRGVRSRLSLMPFLFLMFGSAAITLQIALLVTGTPITGYTQDAYMWILLLTIFPQLIGHSSFNYALRYLPATTISLVIQVEPIISAAAALVLFSQFPTPLQLVGAAVIIIGVAIATGGSYLRRLKSNPVAAPTGD